MLSKRSASLIGAAAVALCAVQAQAAPVFSDNFNDNDVSDWAFSTNYGGSAGLQAAGVLGPFIDAPPGGENLVARATRTLDLLAGDYSLTLDAFSVDCDGCVISYDVLFDGALLTRTASAGAWHNGLMFDLGALTAGSHSITLGMHTTRAFNGRFLAQFDNVVLGGENLVTGGVPEPATWAMMLIGFFGLGSMLRARGGLSARTAAPT